MIWFFGILFLIIGAILAMPTDTLGAIILFILCVLGIFSGVWFLVIPSILLMIGLMVNIFGEA